MIKLVTCAVTSLIMLYVKPLLLNVFVNFYQMYKRLSELHVSDHK